MSKKNILTFYVKSKEELFRKLLLRVLQYKQLLYRQIDIGKSMEREEENICA